MKQPVLLCYNLSGEKMQKIRLAAMRLKIRVRPVEEDEYAQTVAALCGLEEKTDAAYVGAGFEDEMLVMANFPAGMMNAFLGLFRRMGIAPVALKAMLTPTNAAWDSEKLHAEIAGEHQAMMNGKEKRHQPD
ncbi:MAG: DUF3783 domain-containing protein [Christensenellales bacterium]